MGPKRSTRPLPKRHASTAMPSPHPPLSQSSPSRRPSTLSSPVSALSSALTSSPASSPASFHTADPMAPPPILDYTAYPHIVESILSHTPYNALLSLRATNSAFRERVDALLSRHIVLLDQFPPLRSAHGRHPAMLRRRTPSRQLPNTIVWPGCFPWSNFDAANVRVIDFVGFRLVSTMPDLPQLLGNVMTVRVWGQPPSYLTTIVQAEEYILFGHLSPLLKGRSSSAAPVRLGTPNPNLRRVVINCSTPTPEPSLTSEAPDIIHQSNVEHWFKHERLEELVLILPATQVIITEAHLMSVIGLAVTAWNTWGRVVKLVVVSRPDVTVSSPLIVRMARKAGASQILGDDEAFTTLSGLTRSLRRNVYPRVMPVEPFELLSMEEYEAKLGREQFMLETDPTYKLEY